MAVVTGAARGLGFQIARMLAGRGYVVELTDVDAATLSDAVRGLGADAHGTVLDVSDAAACREVAGEVAARHGSLDVWVNNAGLLCTGVSWGDSEGDRRRLVDVNVHGTINGTLAALEVMRAA